LLLPAAQDEDEPDSQVKRGPNISGRDSNSSYKIVRKAYRVTIAAEDPGLGSVVDLSAVTEDIPVASSIYSLATSPSSSPATSPVVSPVLPLADSSFGHSVYLANNLKKRKLDTEGEYKASIRQGNGTYNTHTHLILPYKKAKITIPLRKRKFHDIEQDNVNIRDVNKADSFNTKMIRPYKRVRRLSLEGQSEVPLAQSSTVPKRIHKGNNKRRRPKGILHKQKEKSAFNSRKDVTK
jgi:hypothetical protein